MENLEKLHAQIFQEQEQDAFYIPHSVARYQISDKHQLKNSRCTYRINGKLQF